MRPAPRRIVLLGRKKHHGFRRRPLERCSVRSLRRGQSRLSLAVVAAAWRWAGESAWVAVWVLPLAVGGTGVGVKTGVPVAAGTGVGDGAVAGRRTGTEDRATLGGGVAVGTTAVASMETGAVAVASSSTDSVQAAKTRRITAADEKAVVTFKELQTCFVQAASRRRASNQSVIGGFYSQADSLGVRIQGLNFGLVLVLGCPWFSRPGGPLVLVTIGQRSLEGAMNVHVYTQPG